MPTPAARSAVAAGAPAAAAKTTGPPRRPPPPTKKDDQKAAAKNDADKDKKEAEKKAEELEKRKQAFAELAKAESPKKFSGYVCAVLTSEQQFPGIRQARRETIDIYFTDDEDVYAKYLPMGQKAQEDQKRAAADSAVKR